MKSDSGAIRDQISDVGPVREIEIEDVKTRLVSWIWASGTSSVYWRVSARDPSPNPHPPMSKTRTRPVVRLPGVPAYLRLPPPLFF